MGIDEKPIIGIRIVESGPALLVTDFLNSANNFLRLLSEVDVAISPSFTRTVDWVLHDLSRKSPAVLTVEPIVREGHVDNRHAVVDAVIGGVTSLKEKDIRPRYFSDQALASARELVSVLGERVHQVEIFTNDIRVVCTEIIATNIREILHPGREIMGSVEGDLEAMNSHRGFVFSLYEPVLASRIECELDPQSPVELKEKVKTLYEKKVRVSGTLRTNRKGEVRSAKVLDIVELRRESKIKKVKDISGIFDITGGLDASEYVRGLRDA